jgi:cyclophilin family peptidyl-prolyl cis-trans isomerase
MRVFAGYFVALMVGVAGAQTHAVHHAGAAKTAPKTGMIAYIDTTEGRIVCRLFPSVAPKTVENFAGLASGTKDWMDGATGKIALEQPFYDAMAVGGISTGIIGGDRLGGGKGYAGEPFPAEKNALKFDMPDVIYMRYASAVSGATKSAAKMESSSSFSILDHPNLEYEDAGVIFGQCDDAASQTVVTKISQKLLAVDNRPKTAIAINHITITQPGEAAPPVAKDVAASAITPQPAQLPEDIVPAPNPMGPRVVIDTTMGVLNCRLFKETPVGTANFVGLAKGTKDWKNSATHVTMHGKPFFDGLHFRRVIPGFMVQQSDLPGDAGGDGDIGFHFAVENVPGLSFDRPGRLAYANGGPDTNESEFFVTENPVRRLDGKYTIFGQCDDASVEIEKAMARVPRDAHNRPLKPIAIRKITVE